MGTFGLVMAGVMGLVAATYGVGLVIPGLRDKWLGKLSPSRISDPALRRAAWQWAFAYMGNFLGYALYFASFAVRDRVAPEWQDWVMGAGTLCVFLAVACSLTANRLQRKLNREVLGVEPPRVFGTVRSQLLIGLVIAGSLLGPLLGILIARSFGFSRAAAFVFAIVLGLMAFVPLIIYVVRAGRRERAEQKHHGLAAHGGEIPTPPITRQALVLVLVGLVVALATGVVVFVLLSRGA